MEPHPARVYPCEVEGVRVVRLDWSDRSPVADALWHKHFEMEGALARRQLGDAANVWDAEDERRGRPGSEKDRRFYVAVEVDAEVDAQGERVVGTGLFHRTPKDEPTSVFVGVSVWPEERGRGIGRALHEALLDDAAEAGCTEVRVSTDRYATDDPLLDLDRDERVVERAGYRVYQVAISSTLPLPVPVSFAAARERLRRAGTPGHEIEVAEGVPPQAWLDDLAALRMRMSTDTPPGDRPAVPQTWDAERVRREYARSVELGETVVVAVARHLETGRLVGYTDTSWVPSMPGTAHQGDTLVRAEHRGHGLGRALKLVAIERIAALAPAAVRHRTSNAAENGPMLAVNRELGYVEDLRWTAWCQDLDALVRG